MTQRWLHRRLESCGSTNDEARAWWKEERIGFGVVRADEQNAGRGRGDKTWFAAPGKNLTFSLLFRSPLPMAVTPQLTLMAAQVIAEELSRYVSAEIVEVKWPNDILVNGKKVVGILTEMVEAEVGDTAIIMGIGVNVNTEESEFPAELHPRATSLCAVAGRSFELDDIFNGILETMDAALREVGNEGKVDLKKCEDWMLFGKKVKLHEVNGAVEGRAMGIAPSGALLLEVEGRVREVLAGDVIPLEWEE